MGESESSVPIPPVTDKEELMGRIAESVTAKDSRTLQAYILEQRLPEPEQFWELTTLLAPCLTTENLEERPRFFTTVRRCLTHLSRHGKPKEMVLALLEMTEGFQDDALFITLLPCLQNALLQLPVKRGRSLELALDTLSCHIVAIPAPQNWNLEGEETKLLETDKTVQRFLNVVPAFIEFIQPFLEGSGSYEGEGSGRQWELRVLKKHLLQLLQHPLAFLDLRFNSKENVPKTYSREMAESVVNALTLVEKNFYRLLVQNPADGKTIFSNLRERTRENCAKTAEVEDTDMEAENSENERRASGAAGNQDSDNVEDDFSELSGACLAYLVQVEWLGQKCWPAVNSHSHLLQANLRYVYVLLTNVAHTAVYKGLALLSFYLDLLDNFSLTVDTLDDENYMPVVKAVITVMRFCPIRELRLSGLSVFKTFFTKMDCQGRYQLMNSVLASCEHAGVKAVVVGLVKDEIDTALKQSQSEGAEAKNAGEAASKPRVAGAKSSLQKAAEKAESLPIYFFNDKLKQLLTLATKLPAGAATDLLEESDLIMATLNLLRYLVLRDSCSSSLTGIWGMMTWLEKEYLSALRTGLDMSVGHYQLELNNLKSQSRSGGGEDIVSTVSVAGTQLPPMSQEQRTSVMHSALITFDMMKCVLARLEELIDQKRKA